MIVRYGRTRRPAEYETWRFEIEVDESDIEIPDGATPDEKANRLLHYAQRRLVLAEVSDGLRDAESAKRELSRLGQFYRS